MTGNDRAATDKPCNDIINVQKQFQNTSQSGLHADNLLKPCTSHKDIFPDNSTATVPTATKPTTKKKNKKKPKHLKLITPN